MWKSYSHIKRSLNSNEIAPDIFAIIDRDQIESLTNFGWGFDLWLVSVIKE